jgi:hypothetical protein
MTLTHPPSNRPTPEPRRTSEVTTESGFEPELFPEIVLNRGRERGMLAAKLAIATGTTSPQYWHTPREPIILQAIPQKPSGDFEAWLLVPYASA